MRGKGFGFALVLVVAGYALAGFPPGAAMAAEDTIKIGAVLPLSKAAFSQAGEEQRRGLLMALSEINQGGGVLGKKVELLIEDDTGEPSVGIGAAEKLLTRDKVVALIGGLLQHDHLRPDERHTAARAGRRLDGRILHQGGA